MLFRSSDLLRRSERGAADAHAVVPTLDFQFRNAGFRRQGDQFTDFIDSHQWISLTEVRLSLRRNLVNKIRGSGLADVKVIPTRASKVNTVFDQFL